MTLAALKRRLTVGTQLKMIAGPTWFDQARFPWTRTVAHVQRNAIAFAGDEHTGGRLSWLYWPKARFVCAHPDGFSVYYPDGTAPLVYRFVRREEPMA